MLDTDLQAYDAARQGAVYFDLSSYGKIAVTGPDAASFLHNLSSADIKNLPVGGGCEAFLCNARARTLAHVLIGRLADTPEGVPYFLLDMVPTLRDKVLQHLNKFHISENVDIVDRTGDFTLLRLCGTQAGKALEQMLGSAVPAVPLLHHFKSDSKTCPCVIRRQELLGLPGFDLFCGEISMPVDLPLAGPAVHEVLRIEAGTPEYGKDMDDDRFVMEVGRVAQAISYTKGCYLGQEPIVMARDRGQVNRTLMGVKFIEGASEGTPIASGSKLFVGETEVGQVTSSAWSPRFQQVLALAYLRRGQQQPGTEVVCAGHKGVVAALPFPLAA